MEECEVPFCKVCKHYHEENIRCLSCGHIGKANLFEKMLTKTKLLSRLSIDSCYSDISGNCTNPDVLKVCYGWFNILYSKLK